MQTRDLDNGIKGFIVMNENGQPDKQEECICYCTGTTREKIEILIADGVNTLEGIAYQTGATTGCGACDYLVMEILVQGEQQNRG